MFFCYVLSGRGLCDELITRPEESYRLWRVVVCDQETSCERGHSPRWAAEPEKKNKIDNIMLDTEDAQIDRHGEAFMRIFAILFIASVLKIREKGHQYEDVWSHLNQNRIYRCRSQKGHFIGKMPLLSTVSCQKEGKMEQEPNHVKLRDLL
jgi:hypothetical protein